MGITLGLLKLLDLCIDNCEAFFGWSPPVTVEKWIYLCWPHQNEHKKMSQIYITKRDLQSNISWKFFLWAQKKTDAAPVATATAATPQLDTSQATKHSSQQSAQQANAAFYRMFRDSSFPSFHNPFSSPKDLIDPRHLQWQNIATVDLGWWCLMDGTFLKDSFQGPMRKMFLGYGRLVQYVMCQTWFTISAWVACVRRIASVDC